MTAQGWWLDSLVVWKGWARVRVSSGALWLAGLDGLIFVLVWGWRAIAPASMGVAGIVLYDVAAFAGLILAIYGFAAMVRGGESGLQRSVLCVLFTMLPACGALIMTLSAVGKPV